MAKYRRGVNLKDWKTNRADAGQGKLRIVGGRFKGRAIRYSGDPVTRPMKDNIREALFNLVGGWVERKAVFDLFAGTGAMGLEAISRGASQAVLVERHIPTVRIIEQNVQDLGGDLPVTIETSDSFFWVRQFLKSPESRPEEPWVVFFCPPYDAYIEKTEHVLAAIEGMATAAPEGSLIVVESDGRFDVELLPELSMDDPDTSPTRPWTTRKYSPALVSVWHKIPADSAESFE
jgi:16S rRNA (guanine966-N2)-methyltransferase